MPNMSLKKNEMPSQNPEIRRNNYEEVALGYTEEIAVAAELDSGARILPEHSWRYVDRESDTRRGKKSSARVNVNYIMFEANAAEIELSFNDAAAKPGERLGLNWIHLVKYLK